MRELLQRQGQQNRMHLTGLSPNRTTSCSRTMSRRPPMQPDVIQGGLRCVDKTAHDLQIATGAPTPPGSESARFNGVDPLVAETLAPFQGYWFTKKSEGSRCILDKKKCPSYDSEKVHARAFRTSVLTIAAACMIPILIAYLVYVLVSRGK